MSLYALPWPLSLLQTCCLLHSAHMNTIPLGGWRNSRGVRGMTMANLCGNLDLCFPVVLDFVLSTAILGLTPCGSVRGRDQ